MAKKTIHEAKKETKPTVGTQSSMQEGDLALENFENLAKEIFSKRDD